MKYLAPGFRYVYKTVAELDSMSAEELIAYKASMLARVESLRSEASDWNYTYKKLMTQMHGVCIALETELEIAAIERMESDDSDYGSVGFIH